MAATLGAQSHRDRCPPPHGVRDQVTGLHPEGEDGDGLQEAGVEGEGTYEGTAPGHRPPPASARGGELPGASVQIATVDSFQVTQITLKVMSSPPLRQMSLPPPSLTTHPLTACFHPSGSRA